MMVRAKIIYLKMIIFSSRNFLKELDKIFFVFQSILETRIDSCSNSISRSPNFHSRFFNSIDTQYMVSISIKETNQHIIIIRVCLKLIIDTEYLSLESEISSSKRTLVQFPFSLTQILRLESTPKATKCLNLITTLLKHIAKQYFVKIE